MNDTQFKKGILPLCVLTILLEGDAYGYDITTRISEEMDVKPGTIYLVLGRLKDAGYVTSYLDSSQKGPVRKYYHLTKQGQKYQTALKEEWDSFLKSVRRLLNNG